MYTADGYAVPFNAAFTEIIRRPNSWEGSDAWALLARFTGRLLIIAGENDAVIPPGVIRKIYDSARHAKERTLYVAPGASHLIITDLRARAPEQLDRVLDLMTQTLDGTGTEIGTGTETEIG
jgi:pimeloyl-ACP methyl ester carboxylesterase